MRACIASWSAARWHEAKQPFALTRTSRLHSNPVKRDPVSSSATKNDVEFARDDKKQRVQLAFTGEETVVGIRRTWSVLTRRDAENYPEKQGQGCDGDGEVRKKNGANRRRRRKKQRRVVVSERE